MIVKNHENYIHVILSYNFAIVLFKTKRLDLSSIDINYLWNMNESNCEK